ncbi:MAG: hypothetical protein KA198_07810 [Chitinophagaceae bacterium]|nr:hypothetical protein [Chitinophagaceae bacterium]
MRNVFFFCFVLFSLHSCKKNELNADVEQINLATDLRLNKIKFLNPQIGFAVGGDLYARPLLYKTMDGGKIWSDISTLLQAEQKEIFSLDISAKGELITAGYGGTMYYSKDTGKSFNYIQHPSWEALQDICFLNKDTALWVIGVNLKKGLMGYLDANNLSVSSTLDSRSFELSDIDVVSEQDVYMSGYGAVLRSADKGQHWDFTTAKNDYFKSMSWQDKDHGIAIGYGGSICKTNDGGNTWEVIRNGNALFQKKKHWLCVENNGLGTYIVVGEQGECMLSRNEGKSWEAMSEFTKEDLRGLFFSDVNTCFVVGTHGYLAKLRID